MKPVFKAMFLSLVLAAPIAAHAQDAVRGRAGAYQRYESPDPEEQAVLDWQRVVAQARAYHDRAVARDHERAVALEKAAAQSAMRKR